MSKALESKREMGRVLWEGSMGSARHEGRSEINSSPDVRLFVKAESQGSGSMMVDLQVCQD